MYLDPYYSNITTGAVMLILSLLSLAGVDMTPMYLANDLNAPL